MTRAILVILLLAAFPFSITAQRYSGDDGELRVAMVKMPYSGARNVAELSGGPAYLETGGVQQTLTRGGVLLKPIPTVALTAEEEPQYGERRRLGMANTHLADIVAQNEREGYLSVGLLANCSSLIGMLAGLQQSDPGGSPLRVGLVFIDAHGDFNTPETSLSGMLGGMPLAVSAGLALYRLREWSGLEQPIPTEHIVLGAARDLDPHPAPLLTLRLHGILAPKQILETHTASLVAFWAPAVPTALPTVRGLAQPHHGSLLGSRHDHVEAIQRWQRYRSRVLAGLQLHTLRGDGP